MAEARRRRTQQQEENVTVIDGNKILLGIGAIIVLISIGAFAFWFAGRSSGPAITRQPAVQPQAQVQQVQPVPETKPQTSSQSSTTQAQIQNSSQAQSSGGSGGVSVGLTSDPSKGEAALDFSVPTLDGGTFSLAEQRGKPAVVFFMAYWCPTCVPEARALQKLHKEYGDQLSILALDVDPSSSPEELQGFLEWAGNPTYSFGFDKDNAVLKKYKVRSLDTTVIIDAGGNIVYRDAYPTSYETLKAELEKLIS